MTSIEDIPIIWKKPHTSSNVRHIGTINILLDQFIKRYNKRLQIRHIMIDLEMPKNATGISDNTFTVKLHVKIRSGEIIRAESTKRSITNVMKNITREIDNQTRLTDRQKHTDSMRKE